MSAMTNNRAHSVYTAFVDTWCGRDSLEVFLNECSHMTSGYRSWISIAGVWRYLRTAMARRCLYDIMDSTNVL